MPRRRVVAALVCVVLVGWGATWVVLAWHALVAPPAPLPMVDVFCRMDSTATDVYEHYVVPSPNVAGWCHVTGETVSIVTGIRHGNAWQLGVLQDDAIVYGVIARIKIPRKE